MLKYLFSKSPSGRIFGLRWSSCLDEVLLASLVLSCEQHVEPLWAHRNFLRFHRYFLRFLDFIDFFWDSLILRISFSRSPCFPKVPKPSAFGDSLGRRKKNGEHFYGEFGWKIGKFHHFSPWLLFKSPGLLSLALCQLPLTLSSLSSDIVAHSGRTLVNSAYLVLF